LATFYNAVTLSGFSKQENTEVWMIKPVWKKLDPQFEYNIVVHRLYSMQQEIP